MQLCMKMQKRMQAMETKGKELVRKKAALLTERQLLLDIFRSPQLPLPALLAGNEQELDLSAIETVWQQYQQQQTEKRIELEQQLLSQEEKLRAELSAEIGGTLQQQMEQRMAEAVAEVEARYRDELDAREAQLRNGSGTISSGEPAQQQQQHAAVDFLNEETGADVVGEAPLQPIPAATVAVAAAQQQQLQVQQQYQQQITESKARIERMQQDLAAANKHVETLTAEKTVRCGSNWRCFAVAPLVLSSRQR